MRYPDFLRDNGTIGFVAPSFGCNIEPYKSAFQNALKKFEALGYRTDLGPNCYEGSGVGISNTPEKCAKELMDYYTSDQNDILLSCGGGELMCEILDNVDFEVLKQSKSKWYMGYSDNTNMTFLLATLSDTASVYGPCAPAFGMEPWHEALTDALDILTGKKKSLKGYELWEKESVKDEEHPLEPYNVTEKTQLHSFKPVMTEEGKNELSEVTGETLTMRGRMLGGCMDCLVNLLGTCYDKVSDFNEKYAEDGIIWFLEACDLNVMGIRRAMWQMEHAGWFSKVKGFIIGRPLCHGEDCFGLDQYKAVCDIIKPHGVPVVMDTDIGHIAPMMPIVCGSMATVKVCDNQIKIDMEYV